MFLRFFIYYYYMLDLLYMQYSLTFESYKQLKFIHLCVIKINICWSNMLLESFVHL
jgi:hypothetical protein